MINASQEIVRVETGIQEVWENLQQFETGELFLIKNDGELFGTIKLSDLSELAFDHGVDNLVNADNVARAHPPLLAADDDLLTANRVIRDTGEQYIAVVQNHNSMKFVGTLHEMALMAAYNRFLVEARREEHGGNLWSICKLDVVRTNAGFLAIRNDHLNLY